MRSCELINPEFDTDWVYRHKNYARIRACLKHCVAQKQGVAVITGASGTGKTFLLSDLLGHRFCDQLETANINLSETGHSPLLAQICDAFQACADGETASYSLLLRHLSSVAERETVPLLIIDNAHYLDLHGFEELQRILELDDNGNTPILVFLVGQPQLNDTIASLQAEFMRKHSVAACHLESFDVAESHVYIEALIEHLGRTSSFELADSTCDRIHHYTQGVPGSINRICYQLLSLGRHRVDKDDVDRVASNSCDNNAHENAMSSEFEGPSSAPPSTEITGNRDGQQESLAKTSDSDRQVKSTARSSGRASLTSVVRMNRSRSPGNTALSERRKQIYSALERDSGNKTSPPSDHPPALKVARTEATMLHDPAKPQHPPEDMSLNSDHMPKADRLGAESAEEWESLVEHIRVHTSEYDIPSIYARREEDRLDAHPEPVQSGKSRNKGSRADWRYIVLLTLLLIVVGLLLVRLFIGEDYYVWLQDHISTTTTNITALFSKYLGLPG